MINRISILVICSIFFACNSQKDNKGHIDSCKSLSDTAKICKTFHDGKIIDSAYLVHNKIHGKRFSIHLKDSLIFFESYKYGILEGDVTVRYFNNNLCYKGKYENNERVGKWLKWNKSEEIEKENYYETNGDGTRVFAISYLGNEVKAEGNAILDVAFDFIDSSLITFIRIAVPEKLHGELIVGELDSLNKPKNLLVYDEFSKDSLDFCFDTRIFNSKNKIKIYYEIFDSTDTFSYTSIKTFDSSQIDSIYNELVQFEKLLVNKN